MSANSAGGMYINALVPLEVEPRQLHPRPKNYCWWNGFEIPAPAVYRLEGLEE